MKIMQFFGILGLLFVLREGIAEGYLFMVGKASDITSYPVDANCVGLTNTDGKGWLIHENHPKGFTAQVGSCKVDVAGGGNVGAVKTNKKTINGKSNLGIKYDSEGCNMFFTGDTVWYSDKSIPKTEGVEKQPHCKDGQF